jgi:hypothetical protein
MSNIDLFTVYCLDCSVPASQCLLEADVDGVTNVVVFSLEQNVRFLLFVSISQLKCNDSPLQQ